MKKQSFENKPVSDIIRILKVGCGKDIAVNFRKIGRKLKLSILPYNFSALHIAEEQVLCAFITNELGNSAIFYDRDLPDNEECNLWRVVLAQALAKHIANGEKDFFVTRSLVLSDRENRLMYELLMPETRVHEVIGKLISPSVQSLADIFCVPESFARERLGKLKRKPKKHVYGYVN